MSIPSTLTAAGGPPVVLISIITRKWNICFDAEIRIQAIPCKTFALSVDCEKKWIWKFAPSEKILNSQSIKKTSPIKNLVLQGHF
jgi:hypothetical protein